MGDMMTKNQNESVTQLDVMCLQKIFDETMVLTLRALFDNDLNVSKTARLLKVHRNTINYRLQCFRKVTGLNPEKFYDAIVIKQMMDSFDIFLKHLRKE